MILLLWLILIDILKGIILALSYLICLPLGYITSLVLYIKYKQFKKDNIFFGFIEYLGDEL